MNYGKHSDTQIGRALAALDVSSEIEDYAPAEIEQLPVEVVIERLHELNINSEMPLDISELIKSKTLPTAEIFYLFENNEKNTPRPDCHINKYVSPIGKELCK